MTLCLFFFTFYFAKKKERNCGLGFFLKKYHFYIEESLADGCLLLEIICIVIFIFEILKVCRNDVRVKNFLRTEIWRRIENSDFKFENYYNCKHFWKKILLFGRIFKQKKEFW